MTTVSIELDEHQRRQLRDLAAALRRPEPELCREALEDYLRRHAPAAEPGADRFAALRELIGLAGDGPDDASIVHDYRPGEAL